MGLPWNYTEFHRSPWNSREFREVPWNSMDFHGIPWGYFTRVSDLQIETILGLSWYTCKVAGAVFL